MGKDGFIRRSFAVALAIVIASAFSTARAFAQSGEEGEGVRERAMGLFDRARRQIDDGDVDGGIESCEEAYGIYPTPGALARLGACYEWAERPDDAVETYERIWSSSSADENVRQFAADAIERLTGERPAPPVATPEERQEPLERTPHEAPPPEPSHALPWAFTVGALALAAGAGVAGGWTYSLWSDLDGQADQLREIRAMHLPPYDEPEYAATQADIQDRNPTLETAFTVMLIAGGAALAAGITALILWLTAD